MREGDRPLNGGRQPRATLVAVLFVAVLIGALYWAVQAVVQHNAVQNCLDSGRRDCAGDAPRP